MSDRSFCEFEVIRFEASADGKTWVEIPDPVAELRAPEEMR